MEARKAKEQKINFGFSRPSYEIRDSRFEIRDSKSENTTERENTKNDVIFGNQILNEFLINLDLAFC